MPSLQQNSQSLVQPSPTSTIPQYHALLNEYKTLRKQYEESQRDLKIMSAAMAMSHTKLNPLETQAKELIAFDLDITTSQVKSCLKRCYGKGKLSSIRRDLYEHARRLDEATVETNETSYGHARYRAYPKSSSRSVQRNHDETDFTESSDDEDSNMLSPVKSKKLPHDNITVEIDGKLFTQRQLAKWYQRSKMDAAARRTFELKNIEINNKRRSHASK
ncbi:hypothetical protein ABEF93_000972 [Exophiala dermatitidis]